MIDHDARVSVQFFQKLASLFSCQKTFQSCAHSSAALLFRGWCARVPWGTNLPAPEDALSRYAPPAPGAVASLCVQPDRRSPPRQDHWRPNVAFEGCRRSRKRGETVYFNKELHAILAARLARLLEEKALNFGFGKRRATLDRINSVAT